MHGACLLAVLVRAVGRDTMRRKVPSGVGVGRRGERRNSVVRRFQNAESLAALIVSALFVSIIVIVYLCCQLTFFSILSTDKYLSHRDFVD